jgi:hypothetical protein
MPPHGRLWSWKRHSPLWELSRQSHSVIQVQTWRPTLPGRTTRCPKVVFQRKPWSWCAPNKDSRSSTTLIEDGVITTPAQSISKSWRRAPSGAHDQIFIALWQLRSCFCGAPSLTRGRVCLLYMLLALARRDSWPYFSVSVLRLPFSSPPTTRRVTVEVFEPSSTRVPWITASQLRISSARSVEWYSLGADHIENGASNSTSIVACAAVSRTAYRTPLPQLVHWCVLGICCLATGVVYRVIT